MESSISLYSLLSMGGAVMWPLLILLLASVTIIVERTIVFIYFDRNAALGCETAIEIAHETGREQAIEYCRRSKNAWGEAAALAFLSSRHQNIVRAEMRAAVSRFAHSLSFLDMIAAVAPVLGFLGTVMGMISAFRSIAGASTIQIQLVASGLFEALFTTAFGLGISILAAVSSHIFWHIADGFEDELEHALVYVSESVHETA